MICNFLPVFAIVHLCCTSLAGYRIIFVAQVACSTILNHAFEHTLYGFNCLVRTYLRIDYIRFELLNHFASVRKSLYKHRADKLSIVCNGIVERKHLQWRYCNLVSVSHLRQ